VDAVEGDYDETPARVIFSLTVLSEHPIPALAGFPGRPGSQRAGDDFMYVIHKADFEEDDPETRAYLLDEGVNEALNRLDVSGVDPDELHHPEVRVRAFYTFDPGSETISTGVVNRLARVNAALWIDSNG